MACESGYNDLSREDFDERMSQLALYALLAHGLGDGTAVDHIAIEIETLSQENPGHVARLEEFVGNHTAYFNS